MVSENFGEIIYTHRFEQFRHKMGFELRVCRGSDPENKGRIEAVVKYIKLGLLQTAPLQTSQRGTNLVWTKKVPAEVFALKKQ